MRRRASHKNVAFALVTKPCQRPANAPPVKRTPVIAFAAATLGITALLWRQNALDGEVAALRAALENKRAPALTAPVANPQEPPHSPPQHAVADNALVQAQARIADLERVANAHADLIEELLRRFSEMDFARQKALAPAWSAQQATGPPDTMTDGDHQTAWAPAQADGGEEWLMTEYAKPVEVAQVIVRETCGPGCITKITSVTDAGAEVPLWQGEPPKNTSPSDTVFNIPPGTTTGRIKVYLDTRLVPGWNEIDAVQLVGRDGSKQWAKDASASSSYGAGGVFNLGLHSEDPNPVEKTRRLILDSWSLSEKSDTTGIRPQ